MQRTAQWVRRDDGLRGVEKNPAYAATSPTSPTSPLTRTTIERRAVGANDVRIRIDYSGVCHSDIHAVRGDWGDSQVPLVTGHVIAGVVLEAGADFTFHKVGDHVGVGTMVKSCRECENCLAGDEVYCLRGNVLTYGSTGRDGTMTQGGYLTEIVVDEHFALRIPDNLDMATVAPMLCAGVTTYSPLRHWRVGPGSRVTIVGLGGLGHLAVQFAHALGGEVTVLSQSLSKRDDAIDLGADDYFATSDSETLTTLENRFDVILNTTSAALPLGEYLGMLRLNGTLVSVGLPSGDLAMPPFSIIAQRRSSAGSS